MKLPTPYAYIVSYDLTQPLDKYAPLFRAASDTFPSDGSTAYCHWKVAWDSYLADQSDRVELLREQVSRYPADSRAGTALYFLGRAEEKQAKLAEARAKVLTAITEAKQSLHGALAES